MARRGSDQRWDFSMAHDSAPSTETLAQAAERYVRRGWAIVPLHYILDDGRCSCTLNPKATPHKPGSNGKHPDWGKDWQDRGVTSRIEAGNLWTGKYARHNIGILTGPVSGFWVLDVDPKNGGHLSLVKLENEHAALPPTYKVVTGSGGWHYYFQMPDDFVPGGSPGRLPDGLDVRGLGGQVVAPPSVSGVGAYHVAQDVPMAYAPEWLLSYIRPVAIPQQRPQEPIEEINQPPVDLPVDAERGQRYALTAIARELDELRHATPGRRGGTAFKVACVLIELLNSPWAAIGDYATKVRWDYDLAAEQAMAAGGDFCLDEAAESWRSAARKVAGRGRVEPAELNPGTGGAVLPWGEVPRPFEPPALDLWANASAIMSVTGAYQTITVTTPIAPINPTKRIIDLSPYLDGSYDPPVPTLGGIWDGLGQARFLYAGRWHTLVATTGIGKSWWAIWHALQEIREGRHVAYAHFEEASPVGTVARLRAVGLSADEIRGHFTWLDCGERWRPGEFAASLPPAASVVVLDGINAACGHLGLSPDKPESVGAYRAQFVAPATRFGAAVLSLGHPPKARDRQDERHGFGASGWLDDVDGVGYRLTPGKEPIQKGTSGSALLYCVKDRYGSVAAVGRPAKQDGWTFLGTFAVDDSQRFFSVTVPKLIAPKPDDDASDSDKIDAIGEKIVETLERHADPSFASGRKLIEKMTEAGHRFDKTFIGAAVERLIISGALTRVGINGGRLP
jgi:hypothetical protein